MLFQYLRNQVGWRAAAGWLTLSIFVLIGITAPFYLASPSHFAPFHLTTKLALAGTLIPRAELVVPGLTVALSLAFSAVPLKTARSIIDAAGVIVGFPTYLLVAIYLSGPAPRAALQYFAAGLSATGLYVIALGLCLESPGTDHAAELVTAA